MHASQRFPLLLCLALLLPEVASAADLKDIQGTPQENHELQLRWVRPELPNRWMAMSPTMPQKVFVERIVRGDGPSAANPSAADAMVTVWGLDHADNTRYQTPFPTESDTVLRKKISTDPVLKQHSDFAESVIELFQDGVDAGADGVQKVALDRIIAWKKANKVRKVGPELEKVLKKHEDGEYIKIASFVPREAGTVFEYYQDAMRGYMGKSCRMSKPQSKKLGELKADYFQAKGRHSALGRKLVMEYYVVSGVNKHTLVVEVQYASGMERDREIRQVIAQFLSSFREK